jgi:hypothetical protein
MNSSEDELTTLYRGLSDEYLITKLASGDLTELAQSVVRKELSQRGVDAPAPALPIEESEETGEDGDEDGIDFVTVAHFFVPTEALILRGRLEAEGIPAVVTDANLVQANNLISVAVGGVRVQVPVEFAPEAEGIVDAIQRGEFMLPD